MISPDDWAILTIIGEAASEPLEGQIAVGNVIRNRMKRRYSSNGTVPGTVLALKQFSMWDDHARLYAARMTEDDPEWQKAADAWRRSAVEQAVGEAVLYHADYVSPYWKDASGVKMVRKIGRHIFYHDSGGGI